MSRNLALHVGGGLLNTNIPISWAEDVFIWKDAINIVVCLGDPSARRHDVLELPRKWWHWK
jgi:hypothetical protein